MFKGMKDVEPTWPYIEHLVNEVELKALNILDRLLWFAPMNYDQTEFIFWETEDGNTKKGAAIQLWKRTDTNRRRLNWVIQSANPGDPGNQLFLIGYKPVDDSKSVTKWLTINDKKKAVLSTAKAAAQKFYIQRLDSYFLNPGYTVSIGQYMFYPVDKDGNATILRALGRHDGTFGNSTKIMVVDMEPKDAWRYEIPRWRLMKVHETGEDQAFRTPEDMRTSFHKGEHPEYDYSLLNTELTIHIRTAYSWWQVFDRSKDSDYQIQLAEDSFAESRELPRMLWKFESVAKGAQDFLISTTLNGKKKYVCIKDEKLQLGNKKSAEHFKIRIAGSDTSSVPFCTNLFLYSATGKEVVQGDGKHKSPLRLHSVGKLLDPFEREFSVWSVRRAP